MLEFNYRASLRARNRRLSRTILYCCVGGALACCVGSLVHGFAVSAFVAVATLCYFTFKLERYRRVSEIGE